MRELRSKLFRWRVGVRWYAVALLTVPLLEMAILGALSLTSRAFLSTIITTEDKASLLLAGLVGGLVVGLVISFFFVYGSLPPVTAGAPALIFNVVFGATLWVFVAAVAVVVNRRKLSRRGERTRPTPLWLAH